MGHMPPTRPPTVAEPPCSDASWARRCAPLLVFLSAPRSWEELDAWASARGMSGCRLRNMLAWLENSGVATAFDDPLHVGVHGRHRPLWYRCSTPNPS